MINTYPMEWVLEIQSGKEPEGPLCKERIVIRRDDVGGGPFLTMKTENLEPDAEYDEHTVTLNVEDIKGIYDSLTYIAGGLE